MSHPIRLDKFCRFFDRDFICREAFRCKTPCPLAILRRVATACEYENAPVDVAYRAVVRADIEGPGPLFSPDDIPTLRILRQAKPMAKFCHNCNRDFGCKDALSCIISCPVGLLRESLIMIQTKNLTLGEAYKLVLRSGLTPEVIKEIISAYVNEFGEYPEKSADQVLAGWEDGKNVEG